MLTPRVTEITAVCAHLSVPLGGWSVQHVAPSDSKILRPPATRLTPPMEHR
jgi:hypothetical protein